MIRLDVQPYCDVCPDFTPDVKMPDKIYYSTPDGVQGYEQSGDTVVRCKYRRRCEAMVRYLQKQMEKPKE